MTTTFHRAPRHLFASGAFMLGLFYAFGAATHAEPTTKEPVMLINAKTGKCLTIAGGTSTDNNVDAVQFTCDRHPSRAWTLQKRPDANIYHVRNVQTGKCLTISGGTSTDNNVPALQFDCDSHPSRSWTINDVTGNGVYQLQNVQTHKCLTISGGTSTNDNVPALQFSCDADLSRRWTIRAVGRKIDDN